MKKYALSALLVLAVFLPLSLYAQDVPFATHQVRYQVVPLERVFDGVVEAVKRSTVSAQVSARILEINFDVNDVVPKGSILIRFRDSEQRAGLAQAQALLAEAQARHVEAQAEYKRIKNLVARNLAPQSELDRAVAGERAAQARVEATKAGVVRAREELDYTVVKAPYSGVVVERHVEVGENTTIGQSLMTGLSLEALRASVEIPQRFVERVRQHRQAYVLAADGAGKHIDTTAITIFPYANPLSHTFTVRVDLPQDADNLSPGMFVKVAFVIGEARRLLVPMEALVRRSEVTAVYIVDGKGRVLLRQVRIGTQYQDGMVEVLTGVDEGERVALDPVHAGIYLKRQR